MPTARSCHRGVIVTRRWSSSSARAPCVGRQALERAPRVLVREVPAATSPHSMTVTASSPARSSSPRSMSSWARSRRYTSTCSMRRRPAYSRAIVNVGLTTGLGDAQRVGDPLGELRLARAELSGEQHEVTGSRAREPSARPTPRVSAAECVASTSAHPSSPPAASGPARASRRRSRRGSGRARSRRSGARQPGCSVGTRAPRPSRNGNSCPRMLRDPRLRVEQQLRGEVPERHDHHGREEVELGLEVRAARFRSRRAADHGSRAVGTSRRCDVDVVARQADSLDQPGEQLAGAPDERDPLAILLRAGALADEDEVGVTARRRRTRPACGPRRGGTSCTRAPRRARGRPTKTSGGSGGLARRRIEERHGGRS